MTLNDPNIYIVLRNALMLMTTFLYPNKVEAAKTVMQLWYSAFLESSAWKKLKYELLPFVERAYVKNKKGKATSQVSQRWTKGEASLRLTLTRRQWKLMLEILGDGENIDFNKAVASRKSVVEDPTRKELRSKKLYEMPATYRRAHVRFLKTGMLLPFGQPVGGFDIPNPYVHMLGLGRKNGLD
jgi:hypothetical protein